MIPMQGRKGRKGRLVTFLVNMILFKIAPPRGRPTRRSRKADSWGNTDIGNRDEPGFSSMAVYASFIVIGKTPPRLDRMNTSLIKLGECSTRLPWKIRIFIILMLVKIELTKTHNYGFIPVAAGKFPVRLSEYCIGCQNGKEGRGWISETDNIRRVGGACFEHALPPGRALFVPARINSSFPLMH